MLERRNMDDRAVSPAGVPYARPMSVTPAAVARPAEPYLNPMLMSRAAALVDVALMLVAVIVAFIGIATSVNQGLIRPPAGFEIIIQPLAGGTISLLVLWLILRWRGQNFRAVGLGPTPLGSAVGWGLIAAVAAEMVSIILGMLLILFSSEHALMRVAHQREPIISALGQTPPAWIVPVMALVGVYEELVMRGL